ncbi:hypothetical protein STCU_01193 [Strigomonas culicis]|uniref:Protein root UVB sensitive/RUS domain-containing protein n=1 Tax=Strigomonas culicis TaxID=28005 RepID=S9V2F0_9TRYP|nr:hypothetical protein STCU_07839 [Strigomonas culicis]EPY35214.1 hypothetical protein STCU_01193 [Strigomonas culicis]|eukprot:EPY23159.1 hypothetical protein STCU_07839 [Strigomonas culicis]
MLAKVECSLQRLARRRHSHSFVTQSSMAALSLARRHVSDSTASGRPPDGAAARGRAGVAPGPTHSPAVPSPEPPPASLTSAATGCKPPGIVQGRMELELVRPPRPPTVAKGNTTLPSSGTVSTALREPPPATRNSFREQLFGAARLATRHTRDTLPEKDARGLILCFSQGATDYCWRDVAHGPKGDKMPVVLRAETTRNRVRMFGMPKGFPDTTARGFRRFFYLTQSSSFVSNFASSIGYQSLLSGFFVGSSPQLWMLKDLAPALFAAYMANRVMSYENRPKFWFVISVFCTNVSVISDMIIPSTFPQYLLIAAITTSTVRQFSSLMFYVTRAAALQHFAINNNLAEITKKMNSFAMVTYTVATASGIVFCSFVTGFAAQLATVIACCGLNTVLSSRSMNPIAFRILNQTTMSMLMHEYIHNGKVLSPDNVSELLGVRMLPQFSDDEDKSDVLYISPPVDKLIIRTHTLEDDVLYVHHDGMFMLAMWEPTAVPLSLREYWDRYELSGLTRLLGLGERAQQRRRRAAARRDDKSRFSNKRLVFLVHAKCPAHNMVTAYLIMYTAALKHASSEETFRSFIRACHEQQAYWQTEGEKLRSALKIVGWDTHLPALDHHNYRVSDLLLPPSKLRFLAVQEEIRQRAEKERQRAAAAEAEAAEVAAAALTEGHPGATPTTPKKGKGSNKDGGDAGTGEAGAEGEKEELFEEKRFIVDGVKNYTNPSGVYNLKGGRFS